MGVHSAAAVVVLALVVGAVAEGDSLADLGGAAREIEGAPEVNNLGPWAKGLLKGMPAAAAGPAALAPVAKYPLVLAEERTRRPDVLQHLKMYGGWNVTNKHYWASVSFAGVSGFLLAALWFVLFGLAAAGHCLFRSRTAKGKVYLANAIRPAVLVVFVLSLISGCTVLLYGQSEFRDEATHTEFYCKSI